MERLKLKVRPREDMRKSHIKKLKAEHFVPGNVYGMGKDSLAVEVHLGELAGILKTPHGAHSLIDLSLEGSRSKPELVMIRQLQKDPLTRRLQHVEFQRVSLTEKITATVAVKLVGHAKGAAEGGLVEHVIREVHIRVLPDHVPDELELDITDLEIGQHKTIADIAAPEGVEILGHPEEVVVTVGYRGVKAVEEVEKPAVEEEAPAAEEESTEPAEES